MIHIRRLQNYSLRNRLSRLTQISGKVKRFIIPTIGLIAVIVAGALLFTDNPKANAVDTNGSIKIADAKKSQDINRELEFPVLNAEAEEVGKMKYTIEKAELRDEIIVQGKKATSVPGRTFLVVTMKITNDLDSRMQINTRDYVRLAINDATERLEFTIHNDPVEIGAISTRPTRIAIPIDDVDQKLVLYVGEIKGEKQSIEVNFN